MKKEHTVYCRVSASVKEKIERAAKRKGEKAAVIVREALREYLARQEGFSAPAAPSSAPAIPNKTTEPYCLNETADINPPARSVRDNKPRR